MEEITSPLLSEEPQLFTRTCADAIIRGTQRSATVSQAEKKVNTAYRMHTLHIWVELT